jgi:hypothetical protein
MRSNGNSGAAGLQHAAKLVHVCVVAAKVYRRRQRNGHEPGVLACKKEAQEVRRGFRHDRQASAALQA